MPGNQHGELGVEAVEGLGALANQVVAPVGQQPKGGGVVLRPNVGQRVVVNGGDAYRHRICASDLGPWPTESRRT